MSLIAGFEEGHVWQWFHQEGNKRDTRRAFDAANNEALEEALRDGAAQYGYQPPEERGYYSQWTVHLREKPARMVRSYSAEERCVLRERDEAREHAQQDELAAAWSRKQQGRLEAEFARYADEEDDEVGVEGIEKLCADIGVDTQDAVVLALSWFMRAGEMCVYTKDEWVRGMARLGCSTVSEVKEQVPHMRAALENWGFFLAVYRWSFAFAKESDQKSLGKDEALGLWPILIGERWALLDAFVLFMGTVRERVVSRDLWSELIEFMVQGNFGAVLEPYLENDAWPVLLDDFLEWMTDSPEGKAEHKKALAKQGERGGGAAAAGGGAGWGVAVGGTGQGA